MTGNVVCLEPIICFNTILVHLFRESGDSGRHDKSYLGRCIATTILDGLLGHCFFSQFAVRVPLNIRGSEAI